MTIIRSQYIGLFVVLLFGAFYIIFQYNLTNSTDKIPSPESKYTDNFNIYLVDQAKKLNIDHKHSSYEVHDKIANIGKWFSYINAGVSAIDYNKDGLTDLFFCNSSPGQSNILYENKDNFGLVITNNPGGHTSTNFIFQIFCSSRVRLHI